MIISDSQRFVFVHNPKCGGTAVRRQLMPFDTCNDRFWGIEMREDLGRRVDKAHIPLESLQEVFPDAFEKLMQYFSFTFVRNPYQRFISSYNEQRRLKLPALESAEFKPYCDELNSLIDDKVQPARIRGLFQFRHFVPQHFFTHIGEEQVVKFIGRVETLEADLLEAARLGGLDLGISRVPVSNVRAKGGQPDIEHVLTRKSINTINRVYRRDFALFGFDQR